MNRYGFLKGIGVGVAVGAVMAAAVIPMDKRKLMRSGAGRTIRAIGQVVDSIM